MRLEYRPEIDGLRAIAVISVILYHAEFTFKNKSILPGGFLGVDIFFVISGFLITSLMLVEFDKTGGISIRNFYWRRAKRLLPALLPVLAVTTILAWVYLLPDDFVDYSKSLITSLFFSSNIYWNYSSQQYGVSSALLKPLMHTWSLAVEEQFYIIYPLALLMLLRRCKKNIGLVLITLLLLSLVFSDWMTANNSSFSFYMLPSRLWEMLAGAIVANILYLRRQNSSNIWLDQTMPAVGLCLIIYSIVFIDFDANHPGFVTLIPVTASMLIIGFANPNEIVTKILSSRAFVAIGLISYSLYLWHYPIFAFGRILESSPNIATKSIWICLAMILSTLSYFFIERYFRFNKSVLKPISIAGFGLSATLVTTALVIIYQAGFPSRLPVILQNLSVNSLKHEACKDEQLLCSLNETESKKIFIVGDSHMQALEKPLLEYSIENDFHYNELNITSCVYILNLQYIESKTGRTFFDCGPDLQNKRRDILLSSDPSVVILGGRLPYYLSSEGFNNEEGGIETIREFYYHYPDGGLSTLTERQTAFFKEHTNAVYELLNHGHQVVLIYPIPEVGWHVPNQINTKLVSVPFFNINKVLSSEPITTSFSVYQKRTQKSFSLLDSIVHENIIRIYPHELFCNKQLQDRCETHNLESLFYRDNNHLSSFGAALLVEEISNKLNQNHTNQ